jgi:NAD(P)-dependent dehydrogenase (short-subunit alcohol dehydrogenase family)
MTVLKRPGQAEEMANCIKFLASNDAKYICGTTLVADGGFGVTVPEFQF